MTVSPSALNTERGMFRVSVEGDPLAPALILSNSLGTTQEMWDPQVAGFAQSYRLIRYDTRGHGGSPVTPGPYHFKDLGRDVLAILDALDIECAAFCGLSMGGHTGLWLGVNAPERLNALIVCNSAAKIGTAQAWQERADALRQGGAAQMRTLADSAPSRWFGEAFIQQSPERVKAMQDSLAKLDPLGYAACCDALAESDLRDQISRIAAPTLLVAGQWDPVTTVADAQAMQASIPGSKVAVVPASHLSNLEAPEAFERAVLNFLAQA
ncbi:3-oxoadipate enol-lactonase [Alcaligenes faecalis]|uniref:3-oxoadipate enol-lactonase n=1 Tax=Alcaligenes faecalis TaxID=511 RepID=UPI0029338370|nr:3-oxoadipate enol-lactonase [Alcaligenes faecalis]MDV2117985.1 3-oxoadipate enol-lactonase [Alcaligenes faecalis]